MILYDNCVNWSVFDGEITLSTAARQHLLQTVLYEKRKNIDITLEIQDSKHPARLMNVRSSHSIQIKYGKNVKDYLKQIFSFSSQYYDDLIKRTGKKKPFQNFERIIIHETSDPLVFHFECNTYDLVQSINNNADDVLLAEVNHELCSHPLTSTFTTDTQQKKRPPVNAGNRKYYARNKQTAINALVYANFCCEYDNSHDSFVSKTTNNKYMEPHHLIPLSEYENFDVSLDVEANIISLCSNCHNQIHYGKNADDLIQKLYYDRKDRLKKAGIDIQLQALLDMYH